MVAPAKNPRSNPGYRRRFRASQMRLTMAHAKPSRSTIANAWWL